MINCHNYTTKPSVCIINYDNVQNYILVLRTFPWESQMLLIFFETEEDAYLFEYKIIASNVITFHSDKLRRLDMLIFRLGCLVDSSLNFLLNMEVYVNFIRMWILCLPRIFVLVMGNKLCLIYSLATKF